MRLMNPAGAWALLALPVIVLFYILKQRTEPRQVPSLLLWKRALNSAEADRPFQKLRRSLLLALQLALALLLALTLMRPVSVGGAADEVIFVFDVSASMQARDGGTTRLEKAARDATQRLEGLPEGSRVSILTAGAQAAQTLSRSSDRLAAGRALSALTAENGGDSMAEALSLARALKRELPGTQVIVYTDRTLEGDDITQVALDGGLENRAVRSLAVSGEAAVARVANLGGACEITVECYADGALCDLRTVRAGDGETVSVPFDVPADAQRVEARIAGEDALAADNVRVYAARPGGTTVVVLAGRDNIFLEKALALREDVVLLKTTAAEAAAADAALTVIDGPLPDALPESGALLLVDPDRDVAAGQDTPAALRAGGGALADALLEGLDASLIQVSSYRPLKKGEAMLTANGDAVLAVWEEDGRRAAAFGFDLHDANLPLLKEFPVLIWRLLAYLAPEPLGAGFEEGACGEPLAIRPQSFARAAKVITPAGREIEISLAGGTLRETNELGVYTLVQTDAQGAQSAIPFALHIPAGESDLRAAPASRAAAGETGAPSSGREWTHALLALLLGLTLLEWWVYRRGY